MSLTTEVRYIPRIYVVVLSSNDLEDIAIRAKAESLCVEQCLTALKINPMITLILNNPIHYPISSLSFQQKKYLHSKGYSQNDVIESPLQFDRVKACIEVALDAIIEQDQGDQSPRSEHSFFSMDFLEGKSNQD